MNHDTSQPGIHAWKDDFGDPVVVHTTACGTCNGKGAATYSRSINSPFAGDLFGDDCHACEGQGSIENDYCRCDGCAAAMAGLEIGAEVAA